MARLTDDEFHRITRAIADPQRFTLFQTICQQPEVACQELVRISDVTQATISHHLKELHNAGLIQIRREGKCAHFTAIRRVLDNYLAELARRTRSESKPVDADSEPTPAW